MITRNWDICFTSVTTEAPAAQWSPNSELGQWFNTDSEGSVPAAPLNVHYI